MFRIALIGTTSVILLLAAGSIASARGIGPTNSVYGHALNLTSHVGQMSTGDVANTHGTTTSMPGSSETMAGNFAHAADQMRVRAAQMEAATHMQPATAMDPANGMQSGSLETGTGYMDPGSTPNAGTTGVNSGSSTPMGTTGTGTTHMGGSGGSMMGR